MLQKTFGNKMFWVLAVVAGVSAQECVGLTCTSCLAAEGCGFCPTQTAYACVRVAVQAGPAGPTTSCPVAAGVNGERPRITNVETCPNPQEPAPCAINRCSVPASKCNPLPGATPNYACSNPCEGNSVCPVGQRCVPQQGGGTTCVDACGSGQACDQAAPYCLCNAANDCGCFANPCRDCSSVVGSHCNFDTHHCTCPDNQVPVTSSGTTTCQTPTTNPCALPFNCPYDGQVCVVVDNAGVAAPLCLCPVGTSLEIAVPEQSGTSAAVNVLVRKCRPNPCLTVLCSHNRTCVRTVVAATGAFLTACVCKEGFVSDADNLYCVPVTCPVPLVADQTTGRCIGKCWDNSVPINNQCPPRPCPVGQVPNPVTNTGCGVICPDGTWAPSIFRCPCILPRVAANTLVPNVAFRRCCNRTNFEVPDPASTFPGTAGSIVNQLCVKCDCALSRPITCKDYPIDGRCPDVVCPKGWFLGGDPIRCRFRCWDTITFVDFPERCPPQPCANLQVRDSYTKLCTDPCPDGTVPYNGNCPRVCPDNLSRYECCIFKGGSNCIPPCPIGFVPLSNADNRCVPVCLNGYPRDPVSGKCPEDNPPSTCSDGSYRINGSCFYSCPPRILANAVTDRRLVLDINECCNNPAVYDKLELICRCPDGRRTNDDGRCNHDCNPDTDVACPCPRPLVRSAGKCVCPAGYLLTAGGCQQDPIECPRGLVPSSDQSACVCPDGNRPVGERCPCNPAVDRLCPVTIFNCQWAGVMDTFARCKCLANTAVAVDPMCLPGDQTGGDVTITIDFCRTHPTLAACFCVLFPDSDRCKRPHPCANDDYKTAHLCECDPTNAACQNPCRPGNPDYYCPPEKYCSLPANANKPRCVCFLHPERCTYVDPPINPTECSDADRDDATKRVCYCRFHIDANCFNANGDGEADKGGSAAGGTLVADNTCADNTDSTCNSDEPTKDDTSDESRIRMRQSRDNDRVNDDVDVSIGSGNGKCGQVVFTRQAQIISGSSSNLIAVDTYFRLILQYIVEFGDADDSGYLGDGDEVRRKLDLDTLLCRIVRTQTTINGAICYTITVLDSSGIITFTVTICAAQLSIGTRDLPSRFAFEILEIHWPFTSPDSKLALFFDAYSRNVNDVFTWDDATASLILNRDASDPSKNRGSLSFDLNGRTADAVVPLHFQLFALPLASARPQVSENKAFRLVISADAFAPVPLIIDPVYAAGNQVSTQSQSGASVTAVNVVAAFFVSSILAAIL